MSTRVLMIDDDHGPHDYYVEALTQSGYEVEQVDQSDEFVQRLEVWEAPLPHIIIVDILMPVSGEKIDPQEVAFGLHTGLYLIRKIQEKWPEMPIMILTNQSIEQAPEGVKLLRKPETKPFDLVKLVAQTLAKSAGRPTLS